MVNPFKAMATIFQKIRAKRKVSSELDSRWGDASISYPNGGSWSQYDQPGFDVHAGLGRTPSEQGQPRQFSLDPLERRSASPRWTNKSYSPSYNDRESPAGSGSATIPTGYYDVNVRRRSERAQRRTPGLSPGPGLGIGSLQDNKNKDFHNQHSSVWEASDSDGAFSDDEATGTSSTADGRTGRHLTLSNEELDYSRTSRSPPLSVTSRMRRCSHQSSMTEPTASIPMLSTSRHTSVTSSPPQPSISSEDSRQGFHQHRHYHHHHRQTSQDRKHIRHPKPLDLHPIPTPELVPSYDELYG